MKTVLDPVVREEVIIRIEGLHAGSAALWGKMNVAQMIRHCTLWEEMVRGKVYCKPSWLRPVFGKMALKSLLKDKRPIKPGMPSGTEIIVREQLQDELSSQKQVWIAHIRSYAQFPDTGFVHQFFGKMTTEQVGQLAYKHIDHHLRQFGC